MGLGYVGFPLAHAFATNNYDVKGTGILIMGLTFNEICLNIILEPEEYDGYIDVKDIP